jgi:hypothetical protein
MQWANNITPSLQRVQPQFVRSLNLLMTVVHRKKQKPVQIICASKVNESILVYRGKAFGQHVHVEPRIGMEYRNDNLHGSPTKVIVQDKSPRMYSILSW